MEKDTAFQMAASNIRFGQGTTSEIGMDLVDMQLSRTLVVVDPALLSLPVGERVIESLDGSGVGYDIFSEVSVEPTDSSFRRAAEVAVEGAYEPLRSRCDLDLLLAEDLLIRTWSEACHLFAI